MSIYAIGVDLPNVDGFEKLRLDSELSFLDAKLLLVRPTFQDFHVTESYQGKNLLSESASADLKSLASKWWPKVHAAKLAGVTVVFLIPPYEEIFYDTGERTYSGTGRNRQTTRIVGAANNYQYLPKIFKGGPTYATGRAITRTGELGPELSLFEAFKEDWLYHAYFEPDEAIPTLLTRSGGHCVGARTLSGMIVLPDISLDHEKNWKSVNAFTEKPTEAGKRLSYQLRDHLIALHKALITDSSRTPAPSWIRSTKYHLPAETQFEAEIAQLSVEIESLGAKRDMAMAHLSDARRLKDLLFEKGKPLEMAVRQALEILGFDVAHFKSGDMEFDAVFSSAEGRFIGEVEGKDDKPINVHKISQIRRNVDEDFSQEDVTSPAIGVLFGNGYRLSEPTTREETFTDKVVNSAPALGIVLIRTLDLFRAAQFVEHTNDQEFSRQCRLAIADSAGEIVSFPNIQPDVNTTCGA